jgi:CheY-like chemotaxis protein
MQSLEVQNEASRIGALRRLQVFESSGKPTFDDMAQLAALVCDVPVAVITLIDEERVWFKAAKGLELDQIPRAGSFDGYTILQSGVMIIHDPLFDERFANNVFVTGLGIKFYAGLPLITSDLHRIGSVAVMDRVPHLLTEEQIDSLQILARLIVAELETPANTESQQASRPHSVPRGPQLCSTILLVEDNHTLRELLRRTLESTGSFILPATNGEEAIRLWKQHQNKIDLVITDVAMPQLNGIELADRIRSTHPRMKFLFITGFAEEFPQLNELFRDGANILEKPFLPSELVSIVGQILGPRSAAPNLQRQID